MAFMLNPYEKELDLTNKGDLKLHENACKGVNNFTFDGNIENSIKFSKLIGKHLEDCCLKDIFEIGIE